MNGMALHGGILPVGGTFFVFSDYMRPAVRLAALSKAQVIYSWTHDSVGLGEDGPTHQPVEQLAVAAGHARPARDPPGRRQRDGPGLGAPPSRATARSALILSRQDVPVLETAERGADGVATGRLRPGRRAAGGADPTWS